jgi:hypothetical protein
MRRRISELASKVRTRVRRDGIYVASRYYVGALVHGVHYLVYDRRWDEFDSCRTSGAVTPAASELIGEIGPLEKARYQAMARLPLIWSIKALDISPSKFGFIDYGSGRGRLMLTAARLPFRERIGVATLGTREDGFTSCSRIAIAFLCSARSQSSSESIRGGPHAMLRKALAPVPFEFFVVETEKAQPSYT